MRNGIPQTINAKRQTTSKAWLYKFKPTDVRPLENNFTKMISETCIGKNEVQKY